MANTPPTTQRNSSQFTVSGVRDVELVPGSIKTTESQSSIISNYTEPILYVRSRNIEFDSTSLKPVTRFYPFFTEIDISEYITPKLLEVEMISGKFQIGETVESDPTFIQNKIIFRLCASNHKTGPYNLPDTIYNINPYNQQPLQDNYSESSTVLNVDTKSLELPSESSFYGCASVGMILIGKTSGAVARVSNIRLISDRSGRLIGSFFVPNSNKFGNIRFVNGVNTFTLIDVDSLNLLPEAESFSESKYTSSAVNNVTETNIISTRNVEITFPYLVTTVGDTVTTIQTTNDINQTRNATNNNTRIVGGTPISNGNNTLNRSVGYNPQRGTLTYTGPGLPFAGITVDLINDVGLRQPLPQYSTDLNLTREQQRRLDRALRNAQT